MAEPTPGPWRVHPGRLRAYISSHAERDGLPSLNVAECDLDAASISAQESLANARLISASPDLLAACEWIVQPDHAIGSNAEFKEKATEIARAAIAKAKGTP